MKVANNPGQARRQASNLRNLLLETNTWAGCAEQAAYAFGWDLKKGSMPAITPEGLSQTPIASSPASVRPDGERQPLKMPAGQWRADAGMAESQLLRAEEALLSFDPARQPDIDTLNTWLDDSLWPLAVRLITGAGGQGKTRLALEFCHLRQESGWYTGFLDSTIDVNRMTITWQALRNLDQQLLIVVDYAETRQTAFLALLKAALQEPVNRPVRVLLLARDGGEWWDNLPSRDPACEALLSGYATTGPFRLPALYEAVQDRQDAYKKALQAFAQTLGVTAPDIVPDLLGEHFERPLYVQMAALLALYGERPTTAQGLTKALLNHERRYWLGVLAHFNWPEPGRRAEQLLSLTTLAGGFVTPRAAEPYWVKARSRVLNTADFNSLFRALTALYPGTQGLQPLRPDLLGEALVAQALLRPGTDTLLDAVLSGSATQPVRRNALTVLARLSGHRLDLQETLVDALSRQFRHCCRDIVGVSSETASRLPELAEGAFGRLSSSAKSQVAGVLTPLLKEESVQLAELSCLVSEYLAEKARERFERKSGHPDHMADYAVSLVNYAMYLNRTGRYQLACDVSLNGLELFRHLPEKDLKRFEPEYARCLSDYASHLSSAGQYEKALDHDRQALDIRKRLTQKNPDLFEADYAMSLNNYANHLNYAGQYGEALDHARNALEIHKRLAQKNPDHFEPDYARSLTNYATHLSYGGQYEDALEYARTGLEIRKRLARKNPDRFEPDYAMSMGAYASALSDGGQADEALDYTRHALEIYKRLAQKNPDRFESDYSNSLGNYANALSDAGHAEEALEHTRKGLEIDKRLAQRNPERFERDYATSLSNYASDLSDLGQNEKALEHAREGLEIRKRLAQINPDRFEPDYATSLSNCASHLSDVGRSTEALVYARQSLELRKQLAEKNPNRFADSLFSNICFEHFLAWLCNQGAASAEPELSDKVMFIAPDRRSLLLGYSAFVEGCTATDQAARSDAFRRVLSHWPTLSMASKTRAKPYWLCAAFWCAKFAPTDLLDPDWAISFLKYSSQRQGQIPDWMREVALRLKFDWPE